MILYLPKTLDLDQHLVAYPPKRIEKFSRDKLVYILSLILSIPATDKKIAKRKNRWTPLSSKNLNNKIRNYNEYLDYALGKDYPNDEEAALIITDNQYIVGEKSRWYAYNPIYLRTPELQVVDINDKSLIRNLKNDSIASKKLVEKQYPYLTKWFNNKLTIDALKARKYAEGIKNIALYELKESIEMCEMVDKYDEVDIPDPLKVTQEVYHKYLSHLLNITKIEEGNFFMSIDSNVRRLHTNLTNLKSELRYFLTYDGQQLVSIDIKNSQPFLSIALFNKAFLDIPLEDLTSTNARALGNPTNANVGQGISRDSKRFHLSTVAPEIYNELKDSESTLPDNFFPDQDKLKAKRTKILSTPHSSLLSSLIIFCRLIQLYDIEDVKKIPT